MIEGGSAGGSATVQAAERRTQAERLLHEATRLETVAADEQAMAAQLSDLPGTHAVLHDLTLPDGRGRVDHVVVGPGGAFLVLTRRVEHPLSFQHGQLMVGSATMKPLLDAARVEAQALTQALGTAVVPVIGVVGAPLPADVPAAVDGVLVCAVAAVSGVIARGAHTQLAPEQIAAAADRAVPLLTVAGTRARTVAAPMLSTPPPPPPPQHTVAAAAPAPLAASSATDHATAKDPHAARTRKFIIAAIVSACLVAFAAGTLIRVLFVDDPSSDSSATLASGVSSTTIVVPTLDSALGGATTVPPSAPVAAVPAPVVAFVPVCQTPGSGWSLVPSWPGDVANLAKYDVELLGADGQWTVATSFATADTAAAAIVGQQPNTTITVRIIAVLADGSRSPGTATPILTPATAC